MEDENQSQTDPASQERKAVTSGTTLTLIYGLIGALFCTVLALAAGGYYFLFHAPPHAQKAKPAEMEEYIVELPENISTLPGRVDALSAEMEELAHATDSSQPDNTEKWQDALSAIHARLDALETDRADSANRGDATLTADELRRLEQVKESVSELKKQLDQQGAHRLTIIELLTSYGELEQRVLGYQPYDRALSSFRLAAQPLGLSARLYRPLERYQHEGIPSRESLQQQFAAARDAYLQAAQPSPNAFWGRVQQNMTNLVKIRKIGPDHSGNDPASILARTEYALQQERYKGALNELSHLRAQADHLEAQEMFRPVTEEINGRLNALDALQQLQLAIQHFRNKE